MTPIDLATNTTGASIPVGDGPLGVAITPDGATAYVTNRNDATVTPITVATNTPGATIAVGTRPLGIAITPDGATAYVTNLVSGSVTPIAVATNTPGTAIGVGSAPFGIAITPDGVSAYVANRGDDTVTPITVATNTTGTTIAVGITPNWIAITPSAPAADIDVNLNAQPHLGILVPYLRYTLTAHNTGPDAVTSATLTATLPAGASATNLSAGCTFTALTVTCTYGAIANGAHVDKTFRIPLSLLSLGHKTVTATRTTSAPTDPNPANDNASATCHVISIILATCP